MRLGNGWLRKRVRIDHEQKIDVPSQQLLIKCLLKRRAFEISKTAGDSSQHAPARARAYSHTRLSLTSPFSSTGTRHCDIRREGVYRRRTRLIGLASDARIDPWCWMATIEPGKNGH